MHSYVYIYDKISMTYSKNNRSSRENQNTLYVHEHFFSENRVVYEMWRNMVQPDRPQMTT